MNEAKIASLFDKKRNDEIMSLAANLKKEDILDMTDYSCFLIFFTFHEAAKHREAASWASILLERRELNLEIDVFFNFLSLSAVTFLENGRLVQSIQMLELSLKLKSDKKNKELLAILQDKFFRKTADKVHWIGAIFVLFKVAMNFIDYNSLLISLASSLVLLHVMAFVAFPAVLSKLYHSLLSLYLRAKSNVVMKQTV